MSARRPGPFILLLALGAALMVAPVGLCQASGADDALVGARLKDSKGVPVGQVERVIAGSDGKPLQVLVRVARVLRTLPVDAIIASPGGGYATVLTRAELEALPASD